MTLHSVLLEAASTADEIKSIGVYVFSTLLGGGLLIKLLKIRPEQESQAVQTAMEALTVAQKSMEYLQGELKSANRRIVDLETDRERDRAEIAGLRRQVVVLETRLVHHENETPDSR